MATTACSARPRSLISRHYVASLESKLSQKGHLHICVADRHRLVKLALDNFSVGEGAREQEVEQDEDKDEGSSEDKEEGP